MVVCAMVRTLDGALLGRASSGVDPVAAPVRRETEPATGSR